MILSRRGLQRRADATLFTRHCRRYAILYAAITPVLLFCRRRYFAIMPLIRFAAAIRCRCH